MKTFDKILSFPNCPLTLSSVDLPSDGSIATKTLQPILSTDDDGVLQDLSPFLFLLSSENFLYSNCNLSGRLWDT